MDVQEKKKQKDVIIIDEAIILQEDVTTKFFEAGESALHSDYFDDLMKLKDSNGELFFKKKKINKNEW